MKLIMENWRGYINEISREKRFRREPNFQKDPRWAPQKGDPLHAEPGPLSPPLLRIINRVPPEDRNGDERILRTLESDPAAEGKLDKAMVEYDRLAALYPGSAPDEWRELQALIDKTGLSEKEVSDQYKTARQKQNHGDAAAWAWFDKQTTDTKLAHRRKSRGGLVADTLVSAIVYGLFIPITAGFNLARGEGIAKTVENIKHELRLFQKL